MKPLALIVVLLALPSAPARAQADGGSDLPLAEAEVGERIVELRVEGNRRVEREAIQGALFNKPGRSFDPSRTADDLRALWALNYFSDIQLLVQRLPKGGVVYVVRVEERPAVREVKLSGNEELSKDDLKESVDIKTHSILDLDAVRRNAKKIQEKYVEKGYFLAEVGYRVEPLPESQEADVVFVIREHSKVMVKEIRFLGAEQVKAEELKAMMATREGSYLSFLTGEGTFREEMFQRDLAVVQSAYYDRGFVNVKVEKPIVSISADKRDIYLTIKVEEGESYTIGKLGFSGDLLVAKEELFGQMISKEGETFNRSKLSRDILTLTDHYYDAGYAYANITPLTQLHPERRTIDLTFEVQKGQQVTIERIEIAGNSKTRDRVIRREMRVYEGERFSGTGIRRSRERVNALGFFESVEVSHKPGSDQSRVVVQVEVKEKPTGTFQVGLGFSNVENFIFTAQVSQNNFLGWGFSGSLSAQLSSLRNFFQASFHDPHFLDTNFIFSTDLFKMQADYFDFVRDSAGGDINLGYHLSTLSPSLEDVMVNLTYNREYVSSEPGRGDVEIPENLLPDGVTSSLRLSATWDKRDNRLFPTKGFMLYGSGEYAPDLPLGFLGGTFHFTRYTAYARKYWSVGDYLPFLQGVVVKANATLGYIQKLGKSQLPVSENYFLGGINTVRGYTQRSIGPTILLPRPLSDPGAALRPFIIGGSKQAVFNLELEFPIFDKVGIRGVLFYDAGNAFGQGSRFFEDPQHPSLPLGLFHSVGFGFRWFSPIGPLRFEWGIPLNPRPGDISPLFEFNIGNSF